jgi:hypothetical protein
MATTKPHTHHCRYCGQDVPCEAAQNGGCIFPATSDISCGPCVVERFVGKTVPHVDCDCMDCRPWTT